MAHNPDAFIREVDEDLRHDRLTALWRRYGMLVIAAAVVLVAGTAGVVGWNFYDERRKSQDAVAFDRALATTGGSSEAAATALAGVGGEARTGYAMIARLTAAQIEAASGDRDTALALLDEVANDGNTPDLYRDLARILALAERADELPPDDLITQLRPYTATSPWRHTARELTAAALLRAGDREQAVATLRDMLEDAETPQTMRGRVSELLAALDAPVDAGEAG